MTDERVDLRMQDTVSQLFWRDHAHVLRLLLLLVSLRCFLEKWLLAEAHLERVYGLLSVVTRINLHDVAEYGQELADG